MFDTINGLPVHPLVVHAVVVLLPLSILGTIALAVRPVWRARFGWLLVGITAVGTALIPVATSSGESLEKHVGDPGRHAELGGQLIWFAVPLLVLVLGMVLLDHRRRTTTTGSPTTTPTGSTSSGSTATMTTTTTTAGSSMTLVHVVTGLAVLAAVAAGVQVYRVGDSGAKAVWADQMGSSSTDSGAGSDAGGN